MLRREDWRSPLGYRPFAVGTRQLVGPMVVEVGLVLLLAGTGVLPTWPGLVREVGPFPIDILTDVQVLVTKAPSIPVFLLGLLAAVLFRTTVLSFMLGDPRDWWPACLRLELLALTGGLVVSGLMFSGQAVLYTPTFYAGLAIFVVCVLTMAPLPWRQASSLTNALRSLVDSGGHTLALLAYLCSLAGAGSLLRLHGIGFTAAPVGVSGAITMALAHHFSGPPARPSARAIAGLIGAGLVVALLVGVIASPAPPRDDGLARQGSLFLVPGADTSSGHGTMFKFRPEWLGFSCAQTYYYSYAGLGNGAKRGESVCPIRTGAPYGRIESGRALTVLSKSFIAQLQAIPSPLVVVADSEGGWVAWKALSSHATKPGGKLVVLSAFTDAWVTYPQPSEPGPGSIGSLFVRAVASAGRFGGFTSFDPRSATAREVLSAPGSLRELFENRLRSKWGALLVTSAYDLAAMGRSWTVGSAFNACPEMEGHTALVLSGASAAVTSSFLAGRPLSDCGWWNSWAAALGTMFGGPPEE